MLGDYLRACWRGVLHNKTAAFINVAGLALGLAVFIALTFYVKREFSWDAHWDDADRIYRAAGSQESPNGNTPAIMDSAPYAMGAGLQALDTSAFEVYTRVYRNRTTLEYAGEDFPNQTRFHAEPSILELLQLRTLAGSLQEVFANPRAIAIHERLATQIFAEQNPLDKTITLKGGQNGDADFVIKAVFQVPEPSVMSNMSLLALLDPTALPERNVALDKWNFPVRPLSTPPTEPQEPMPLQVTHYFKLNAGVDPSLLESDLRTLMDDNHYLEFGNTKTRFVFQNLQQVHLMPGPFDPPGDNVQRLWIYAAIGILVLVISGCNFVMLATLRLVDRMREVGIRKSMGAAATQLMRQHLLDAFCHTLVAACIAVALLALMLPVLQEKLDFSLGLDLLDWRNLGAVLLIAIAFTLLSSAWPAWLMSRGKPARLLRDNGGSVVSGGNGLRKILVGIQFSIVIVLLLATAVVQQQIEYSSTRDRGYSLDDVIATRVSDITLMTRMPALVSELNKLPGVAGAAVGGVSPGLVMITTPQMVKVLADDDSVRSAGVQSAASGAGYFEVMSVAVLAGREFTAEQEGAAATTTVTPVVDSSAPLPVNNVLLNESAVRALGFRTPEMALGQLLESEINTPEGPNTRQSRVIGVVGDTQFSSVMLPPVPQVYAYSEQNSFLAVKLEKGAEVTAVNDVLKSTWETVMGDATFTPYDPSTMLAFELRREEFEASIITGSTLLAIVIALLGLYGLVAATVIKRVKEIGVRKVMGADRRAIVALLLWQFSKPILLASVIAWPFGFWAMRQWLQRFPYQLDTVFIVFCGLAASVVALLIAWLTVGLMAARAASVKPVAALRYE